VALQPHLWWAQHGVGRASRRAERHADQHVKLDGALNQTSIDQTTRRQIIDALWPLNTSSWRSHNVLDLEPFFRYYTRQCHFALIDRGQHVFARTHQDIVDVVRQVENAVPREVIKESLRPKLLKRERPDGDEVLEGTIDLAARIHVMINITSASARFSQSIQLKWTAGPLKPLLIDHFTYAQILGNDGIQLEPTFTAANLELIAGIKVQPTDNLADHLRMIDIEDKVVAVFHHASFLRRNTRYARPRPHLSESWLTPTVPCYLMVSERRRYGP